MSRIETSCTEMDFHSLYARQPITPARTQQSPPPTGQQETTDASVIRTSLQVPQKRAQASTVNNLYSASRKTDAPSASTLSNRLLQTDARIRQLAQRQPDFKPFIATAFRAALDLAFPNVRQPLDPEQIYVTEYVNAVVVLSGDNHVPERRPASSVTLSQALHNALDSGHIPSYNTAQTGFFYAAGNAVNNPAEVVQGMHTSADVITFENILRSTAERSAGDYRHAVQKYWHQIIGGLFRNRLHRIPVLHDLAVLQTENIDNCVAAFAGLAYGVHMQNHIITIGEYALDLTVRLRITFTQKLDKLAKSFRTIGRIRIVLNIFRADIRQCRIGIFAIQALLVKGQHRLLVARLFIRSACRHGKNDKYGK